MSLQCEHGRLRRKCEHCELNAADARVAELEALLRERDAQCAAMREAANEVLAGSAEGSLLGRRVVSDAALTALEAALATDAGKAMMERLEKAERERDELLGHREKVAKDQIAGLASTSDLLQTVSAAARAQAIEECAKVAEDYDYDRDDTLMQTADGIAAAIRALGET